MQSSAELRMEIATLEAEILHLERYLLSLYRTAFEEHLQTLSSITRNHLEYKTGSPKPIVPNKSYYKLEPKIQKVGFFNHDQASPAHDLPISDNDNSAACLKLASTKVNMHSASLPRLEFI